MSDLTTLETGKEERAPIAARVTALWQDATKFFREYHDQYGLDLEFLLQHKHYKEGGPNELSDRIKPTTADLYDIYRHKMAQISRSEIYFDAWPVNKDDDDPNKAEAATIALDAVIRHPKYGYKRVRRKVVGSGLAGKIGVCRVYWDARNEHTIFRSVDPRNFYWEPGTYGPEDPECTWVIEKARPTIAEIRNQKANGWKNTEKVMPDDGRDDSMQSNNVDGEGNFRNTAQPNMGPTDTKRATILFFWQIDRESTRKVKRGGMKILEEKDRFQACIECGFELHSEDGSELPIPSETDVCPSCGAVGKMQRFDALVTEEEVLTYPKGRLVIVNPHTKTVLYDDQWPEPMRSFPYMTWQPYEHVLNPWGTSDVEMHRSAQIMTDVTIRFGYEQMVENRRLMGFLEDGVKDWRGEPFIMGDWQGSAFFAPDVMTLQQGIRDFQGSSVPSGWSEFLSQVTNKFVPNRGTSDIYLTPDASKKIPVGTAQILHETGELPVDDHIETLRDSESIFFGVVLDIVAHRWTLRRWIRYYGKDGAANYRYLQGADIPESEVRVTASPRIKRIEQDQMQAITQALQLFLTPGVGVVMGKMALEAANIPASRIQRFIAEFEKAQQAMQPQQPPPGEMLPAQGVPQANGSGAPLDDMSALFG